MAHNWSRSPRKVASGRASAVVAASWNGPPTPKVRNCLTVRMAATAAAGPLTQPTFQPVAEKVFPAEEMVRVRSAMPGNVASGT